MQAILNNPLASANYPWVSQGQALAAFAIIILECREALQTGNFIIPVCAFVESDGSYCYCNLWIVSFLPDFMESMVHPVWQSAPCFRGATLLQYFADEVELNALVFWTFGDLGSTDWKEISLWQSLFPCRNLFYSASMGF